MLLSLFEKHIFVAQEKLSPIFLLFATEKQQFCLATVRMLFYTASNKGNANANKSGRERE
ncbi:hypothetical protein [uncultured Selenomonas sp.]|uniref:hypothetical protein n=1 Tax=uncultured Selenomonas sp. TaxID=159275 RepID=UPI0025F2DB37|nr:hypothetical protein [uncultured Selenomonas sp.]